MNPLNPRSSRAATAAALAAAAILAACASSSKDITAVHVPTLAYQSYDCGQLAAESQRIHVRTQQLAGRLDEAARNDKAIAGVGMLVFWPALFALGGTKEQEAEYARLKGEHDAVMQTAVMKKCPGATAVGLSAVGSTG